MSAEKVVLFGVPIDNLTMAETLDRIDEMIRSGKPHQHVVVNVDKIVKLQKDPVLREAVMGCDLINVDGQPVVWASMFLKTPLKERVTGVDLFSHLVEMGREKGYRVYLLGARQDVVAKVAKMVKPVGWRNGYWEPSEEPAVVAAIREAKPDVLFVAMSSPKKELFLSKWKAELQIPFVMGVGGTFDVVAGVVGRAPRWMQRCGLEWLYRLLQEPGRMWRRYLVEDLAFFGLVWREWRRRR